MAYHVGPSNYVVTILLVRGSKASNTKLVLHRELRSGRTWFPAYSTLVNKELLDATARELFEEFGITKLTVHDSTLLITIMFEFH
jgi:8-oxo-dGTP pyrophosphatase MutT (NUDIX family)